MVGGSPPQKPWERAGPSSGPAPFKPTSAGSTSDVVEASGTAQPGEVSTGDRNTNFNRNTVGRPVPTRPWEQQTYGSTYGGINNFIYNRWILLFCSCKFIFLFNFKHFFI